MLTYGPFGLDHNAYIDCDQVFWLGCGWWCYDAKLMHQIIQVSCIRVRAPLKYSSNLILFFVDKKNNFMYYYLCKIDEYLNTLVIHIIMQEDLSYEMFIIINKYSCIYY